MFDIVVNGTAGKLVLVGRRLGQDMMKDWNENEIACPHSKGGVTVVAHPFENLIRTGCHPWPPEEILQKLYKSRQVRAFTGDNLRICTSGLGETNPETYFTTMKTGDCSLIQ